MKEQDLFGQATGKRKMERERDGTKQRVNQNHPHGSKVE